MSLSAHETTTPLRSAAQAAELTSAFELFNSVSQQLATSYRQMEQQVGQLNRELHQETAQRLQELREKERVSERLQSLLTLLPAGVVVLDNRGQVSDCNPAAIDLLGEPLTGQRWRDIIARSFAPRSDDGHEISLRDGRRISIATRSLPGQQGQLLLLTDLTETRELQKRLSRHRRLSEMGRMMSSLAHQIRTPLTAAMLYAGHLSESHLNDEQRRRFAGKVLSRLQHLERQVQDMLIFVRGDVRLTDTLSCAQLLQRLQAALEVPLARSQAQCELVNGCPDAPLHCNADSMVGALMNLINNAMQSRQGAVVIRVECRQHDAGTVEICVADDGPGIPADVLASLDEPFVTTKAQGTGLGLSVVRAVCQAHHGQFVIESCVGAGTQARIRLPVLATVARRDAAGVRAEVMSR